MHGELAWRHLVAGYGVFDEGLGQLGGLGPGDQPGDDFAAEDVEHDVEVVVRALFGPLQLGYVPAPDLVRAPGDELWAHPGRVGGLAPAFAGEPLGPQGPVEGRDRGDVGASSSRT